MWETIGNWLAVNYPGIFISLIIGGVLVFVVWKMAKFYYTRFKKTEDAVKDMSGRMDKLPCSKHDESFAQIMEDITVIRTFLMTKNPNSALAFSKKQSPRVLNSAGESLYNDISGNEFLNEHKDFLYRCIDDKAPKTALDVEIAANEVLIENLDSEIFDDLKVWVYNSPSRKLTINGEDREYAVTMNDICFVLSLPLRDMYLESHPSIKR